MWKEFREFISRGSVIDLAVGIIIGTAFTGIVNSLVSDLMMPLVGVLLGQIDFSDMFISLTGGNFDSLREARRAGAITLNYGEFITHVIRFLIVAFAVFLIVKQTNRFRRHAEAAPPPAPTRSEALLEEIRDLLKKSR